MGTLVGTGETDIDQFIRGHKTKLQEERTQLNQYTDQSRYPGGGQTVISPSGRKQWDRNNAQGTRPAEERRAPAEPEEINLLPVNEEQEKKRQQLQAERYQEYNDLLAKRGPQGRRRPRTPLEVGLPLGSYEKQRKAYVAERQTEMQQAMASKRQQVLQDEYRREQAEEQRLATEREGLPIGASERQKLGDERNREYNEYLAKNAPQRSFRKKEPTPENLRQGLPLDQGRYNEKKRQLETERQREYNELIQKKPQRGGGRRADVLEGKGATLPVGEIDERRRQQLISERQREYNEQQQQKLATNRQRGLPPKPPTPNHFFKNIGQHDRQQQMLGEERKKEYNQKLAEERSRTAGRSDYGAAQQVNAGLQFRNPDSAEVIAGKDVFATLPGLHYSDSAEGRKAKARNDEYNEFLQEKKWKDAHRFDKKKPPTAASRRHSEPSSPRISPRGKDKEFATLPGLHYSDSAEKRKIQERNKEYNEMIRQKQGGARKGWATPTYEEILEQKRREEALRRQDDDYGPADAGMRRYASEGAINSLQNEFRDRELDKEFESRKVRFDDEFRNQNQGGILNDDNWLNPELRREQEYSQLAEPVRQEIPDDMAARVRQPFLASLPVGQDERESAKRRRQSELRRELQLQMEETKAAKKREKVQELRVNASGLLDPEKSSYRMKGLEGQPGISPRREYRAKEVQPYHTKFLLDDSPDHDAYGQSGAQIQSAPPLKGILSNGDIGGGLRNAPGTPQSLSDFGDDLQLDLGGRGGRERGRRRDRDAGLLDPGFAGLLDSRRPVGTVNPPAALLYQPSTYVTGGGGLEGGSSIDEAYRYYGMTDPLQLPAAGGGGVPSLNLGGDYGGGGVQLRGSPTPRVTFADEGPSTGRQRDRSKERILPYQFSTGDEENRSRSRTDTQNYGAELERQIQAKRMQKMREKQEQERYERKLEEEIANYNPWGKGGGGAPIRDETGNPIADLRSLQKGGPGSYRSPRANVSPTYSPRPPDPRDDLIKPPPPQQTAFGDATHARGGHGIFGQPKTDAEKDQSDKYKDDLREQIAEKRRRDQMEKERERMEEEKENRRLEEQRLRMQSEYEEEQKKIKAREEETRRKNEELKKQAEDRKKEAERKRREADDAKMKDQQEQIERERKEREQREAAANERLKSPPVPAIKTKTNDERGKSPPLPAHRRGRDSAASNRSQTSQRGQPSPAPGPSANRPQSSDVLTQLASMRKQLQSERKRVEYALETSKNEPDIFDHRTVQRPQPPPNKLIFENAVNKNASLIHTRAQSTDIAQRDNLQRFSELKNKDDTDSRRAFRSMFPDAPVTNMNLETQQAAMLRQQEDQLRALRERIKAEKRENTQNSILSDPYDPTPSNMSFGRGRGGNISARSQLASNSQFIDVEGINHFPEDFEDMVGARNDDARARRRERYSPRPYSNNDGMGSQASLDVDRIQRKNEERLRKLNNMSSRDDVSVGDPDDILERFMAKQRYNRPASGNTLMDDTWLKPGSKAV